MTAHSIARLLRAIGASILLTVMAGATTQSQAFSQDAGQWVLWKGSDKAGGDKMYLYCVQNGARVVDLVGLKSFSEFVLDGKVNRVRFKYNQDSDEDAGAFRVMNVAPQIGTLCQWGMAQQ